MSHEFIIKLKFQFDFYQRPFKQPLRTSHGIWRIREGIIVSLQNSQGKIAQGEIAPLPWFGSETIEQAQEFCQQLGNQITAQDIATIPNQLPACQFGLGSAWLALSKRSPIIEAQKLDCCYLLPAGNKALSTWQPIYQQQHNSTFKWKIGVEPITEEIEILQQLVKAFPPRVKLRLDANGSFNLIQAQQLLAVADNLQKIEFIEQPLSPNYLPEMIQLSQEYTTPLALDESVANFQQLQMIQQQGWSGIYVIKAGIMGFPQQLLDYCQQHSLDVVFSSVLETEIGRQAALHLAQQLHHPRAVGFGINHWFSPVPFGN